MPSFAYVAIDAAGASVQGQVSAESAQAAMEMLAQRGYIPTSVKAAKAVPGTPGAGGAGLLDALLHPIAATDIILFTKQFKAMFQAGVALITLLEVMEKQTENPRLKRICATMARDIQAGASLQDAFARHPRVFSSLYSSMVRAGEASGRLPEVLDRLVGLLQHEHKIKSDIMSALQYPIMVVVALVGAFLFLLTFVIPKFVEIFSRAKIELPLPTRMCMLMYTVLIEYWPLALLAFAAVVTAFAMWFRTEQGKLLRDAFLLRVPIIGPVLRKAAMSRFSSIFSILHSSGVGVMESIDILTGTIGNAAVSRAFRLLKDDLQQGRGIAKPLEKSSYFPPMVVNMIAIGEESGNLGEMLTQVSHHYDDEVSYAVSRMSAAIGPVLVVALAAVVGFFALAIFMPMWDLTKMVNH